MICLLAACQFQPLGVKQQAAPDSVKISSQNSEPTRPKRPVYPALSKETIQAQATLQGNTLTLRLKLPPLPAFKTQLLDLVSAHRITTTVTDSRGKIYDAVGADINHRVTYPVSGVMALTFNNLVPDDLLFVNLQVVDTGLANITQADLSAVIKHTTTSNPSTSLDFQTTAVAKTMSALLSNNASRARSLDLTALNTLMNSITGIDGSAPDYTYTTHPSLVLVNNLATALVATDPGSLTAASYRGVGGTVTLNVSGLVGSDKLQVQITDAASAVKTNLGNGANSITRITPGSSVQVKVAAFGSPSVTYTYAASPTTVNLSEGGSQSVSIAATPNISISNFSPTAGPAGTSVTITGTGFTGATAVRFNGVDASSFTVDSATQITATVPTGTTDGPITVVNGGSANSASNFDVYRTIFVKADAGGSNNGTSWTHAYTSLQAALSAATANDDLWIAAGNYTPGTLATDAFQMKVSVDMYGGFAGSETLLSQRNPATNQTILNGDLGGDDTGTGLSYAWVGTNSRTVIRGANSATLDGVTVRGGSASGSGGGMHNVNVSPTLNQVIFEYNQAVSFGGGMFINGVVNPLLTDVSFRYNRQTAIASGGGGAGLYIGASAAPTLNNSIFEQNIAGGYGGGVYVSIANPSFNGGSVSQNQSGSFGGGLAAFGSGTLTLNDMTFTQNETTGDGGGGICTGSGMTLHLNRSQLSQNTAAGSGGGIYNTGIIHLTDVLLQQNSGSGSAVAGGGMISTSSNATATLTRVAFINNSLTSTNFGGGGLSVVGGSQASLSNVLFAGNSVTGSGTFGGGMALKSATASLKHVTFANNTAPTGQGFGFLLSTLTMQNTLFWNNDSVGYTPDPDDGNVIATVNPFENDSDPLGGDGLINANDGLRIKAGSTEVIGVGTDAGISTDILNISRNGNPEPGAYEFVPPPLPANVVVVDKDALGANNGSSWADAYTSLKTAMDNTTTAGKEIWVAEGTYTPGLPNTNSFQMRAGVSVYGGFAGNEYLRTVRDPVTHPTILSGDLDGDDTGTGLSYAWVGTNSQTVIKGANSATLDGVTVRGGSALTDGGGMNNTNVSPTLNQVIFEYNQAIQRGGGMYIASVSVTPVLNNVTFRYNRQTVFSLNQGGAGLMIHFSNSNPPTLNNCTFSQNISAFHGGGIFTDSASLTMNGGSFSQNQAYTGGGIATLNSGTLTMNDMTFTQNTTTSAGGGGGGISNTSGVTLHLNRSQLSQNTSISSGGGIINLGIIHLTDVLLNQNSASGSSALGAGMMSAGPSANTTLTRVAVVNNSLTTSSGAGGGGLAITGGSQASLSNVLFAGNSVTGSGTIGGGMILIFVTASLKHVTFVNNTASTGQAYSASSSTLTMQNTLFWNNTVSGYTPQLSDGNVVATVNPFENASDPLGGDGLLNANDGLRIKAGSSEVIGVGIDAGVSTDILGLGRNGNPEPGAYEYTP